MSYIAENFERKELRRFSWIRSGSKFSVYPHIAPVFCTQSQKTAEADANCVNFSDEWQNST